MNTQYWEKDSSILVNALSVPPEKYDRKVETLGSWREPFHAVEHVT